MPGASFLIFPLPTNRTLDDSPNTMAEFEPGNRCQILIRMQESVQNSIEFDISDAGEGVPRGGGRRSRNK